MNKEIAKNGEIRSKPNNIRNNKKRIKKQINKK